MSGFMRITPIAACLLAGTVTAQAATCDLAAADKEVTQQISASQNINEKLLLSLLEELNKAEQAAKQNKTEEACAIMAKMKEMIPK